MSLFDIVRLNRWVKRRCVVCGKNVPKDELDTLYTCVLCNDVERARLRLLEEERNETYRLIGRWVYCTCGCYFFKPETENVACGVEKSRRWQYHPCTVHDDEPYYNLIVAEKCERCKKWGFVCDYDHADTELTWQVIKRYFSERNEQLRRLDEKRMKEPPVSYSKQFATLKEAMLYAERGTVIEVGAASFTKDHIYIVCRSTPFPNIPMNHPKYRVIKPFPGHEVGDIVKPEDGKQLAADYPDFFVCEADEKSDEPLYPAKNTDPTIEWNHELDISYKRPKWHYVKHMFQFKEIVVLVEKVLQNRLNLLHEKWNPDLDTVVYSANETHPESTSIRYEVYAATTSYGANLQQQQIWKTSQQAQDECDLLNALHHVSL